MLPSPAAPTAEDALPDPAQSGLEALLAGQGTADDAEVELPAELLARLRPHSAPHAGPSIDLASFLEPSFDPQVYANQIIEGNPPPSAGPSGASRAASASLTAPPTPGGAQSKPGWSPAAPAASTAPKAQGGKDVEGDVSVALSRLNLSIDEVGRVIKEEVTAHAPALLAHTHSILSLSEPLKETRTSLESLSESMASLNTRIAVPYATLGQARARLARVRGAEHLVERAAQFVRLAGVLEQQMGRLEQAGGDTEEDGETRGRALARAALCIRDIAALLAPPVLPEGSRARRRRASKANGTLEHAPGGSDEVDGSSSGSSSDSDSESGSDTDEAEVEAGSFTPLTELNIVQSYIPIIDEWRGIVTDAMEDMVVRGLRDLSPALLATSLQTAFNLGQLPALVRDLLADLTDVIRERCKAALDVTTLAKEAGAREPTTAAPAQGYASYRPRRNFTPGAGGAGPANEGAAAQAWNNVLWRRLETLLVQEMGAVCSKVYTLERVLRLKSDAASGRNFLEEALSILGDKPSFLFWSTFSQSFDAQSREAARASPFVAETLSAAYPRLIRLFHDFFRRVATFTDSTYTNTQQSPETVVMLRSVSHFETSYLSRSNQRLSEAAGPLAASARNLRSPNAADGEALARTIGNELDSARFDPLLLRAVTTAVERALEAARGRTEALRATDSSAYTLTANETTASQMLNADLANATARLTFALQQVEAECPSIAADMIARQRQALETLRETQLVAPLLDAVKREISTSLARMHHADFARKDNVATGAGSVYMSDVSDRMWYIREALLLRYEPGVDRTGWTLDIARHALRHFVLHASLIRPLGEAGKLKLTSDMTELEFATSQLLLSATSGITAPGVAAPAALTLADCGEAFKALRSFRPLLFREQSQLCDASLLRSNTGLSPLIVAHHILVRSPLPLPHEVHGWARAEYVRWLEAHREDDAMALCWTGVQQWEARDEKSPEEQETGMEALLLLRRWTKLVEEQT